MGSIETIDLGTYQQQSRRLLVSDPCYRDATGQVALRAEPGIWHAKLHVDPPENFVLEVFHERFPRVQISKHSTFPNVDTGLIGFYDQRFFRDAAEVVDIELEHTDTPSGDAWRDAFLLGTTPMLLPHGVICATSRGDGEWPLLIGRKFHRVIRALVVFDNEVLSWVKA